jgi:predicted RNA-binding protein with TRAM domain
MSYGNRNRNDGGGNYSSSRGRGFGGSSFNAGPKPVEVGKQYDVEVAELSRRGDGVAKIQGFIIFVKGARVGDKVKIKIETVGPRFATAIVLPEKEGRVDPNASTPTSNSNVGDSSVPKS